tara:strand:+ start:8612 stop:10165 length:1554 start_codon:yes stop_codon:yes gene_type:complete
MSAISRVKESWQALRGNTSQEAISYIGSPEPDEHLWKPMGANRKEKNLPSITQQHAIDYAHYFYKSNPIAKRIIDLTAEYVVGDGITYVAEDRNVQDILDSHWTDPTNNWTINQFSRVRDLGLTGELCIPVYVNEQNGHVTLGNIDTAMIESVVENPENTMKQQLIILRKFPKEDYRRAYRIIDVSSAPVGTKEYGRYVGLNTSAVSGADFTKDDIIEPTGSGLKYKCKVVGACFFFTINNPMTANRGWSDLLPDMDWIDAHDQFLFSSVEKAIESSKYVLDVTLTGKNEQQIREWLRNQRSLKPGERFAHNENVSQEFKTPDLKLEDSASLASVLKNHVLAGAGLPPIWFAESLTSRASAPEMTEPAYRHLKMRQKFIAYIMTRIFRFVLDQAIIHGRLRQDSRFSDTSLATIESASFYLRMPEVSFRDQRANAIAVRSISTALKDAVGNGFIETDEASRIFTRYLGLSGIDAGKNEPHEKRGMYDVDSTLKDLFQVTTEKHDNGYTYYPSRDSFK